MSQPAYLIDSHCHLHDLDFYTPEEQAKALAACAEKQVEKLICIGTDHEDSFKAAEFAAHNPTKLFWSYGIHPNEFDKPRKDVQFEHNNRPVAIGEVGLDYHYGENDKLDQARLLEEMLDLAIREDLPLIFHVREAFDDFFAILDNFSTAKIRGVVHSFSDNKKNLKKSLERDFYIGVNGLATYSTLPMPPIERILLETDAPFLAPVPLRGQTNQPVNVHYVAKWISEKLGLDFDEVARITTENSETLFNLGAQK
ncbi:TatD family hydrolase [Candidatus Saccharibacteria bacterium]|nr:TatD family hydrolase [Candidatus Saccharibacteria bacterium]